MSKHKYKLAYDLEIHPGEYKKEELIEQEKNGTDALLMASILYPEDGSMNVKFLSFDGQNDGDRMPDIEKFKVWILLARKLGELDGLPKFHREFAQKVVDSFKENRPEKYNDKGELISDVQSNGASVE